MKKYILEGLDCADCALKIEKNLKDKEYVKDISVSYATKTMLIDTENIEKVKEDINVIEKDVKVLESSGSKSDIDAKYEIEGLENEKILLIISTCLFVVAFITEMLQKSRYIAYDTYYFFSPLYVVVYIIIGLPILVAAYNSIISKNYFNEKVLMSISTLAAFAIGAFEESCAVMLFYAIGEYFQSKALINSRRDIKNLLELEENVVNKIIDNYENIEEVAIEDVKLGEYIMVKAGQRVPLDGILVNDAAEFDMSALTGESKPLYLESGSKIYSGSINISTNVIIKVTNEFENSSMFKLVELIENSMHKKTKIDKFITNFSNYYTPIIITLAIIIAILPPLFMQNITFEKSIYSSIVLLVIACPCALVLSIPLTYFTSLGYLAKNGVLVKDISSFDSIENATEIYLDKTGTITEGIFKVSEINEYFDELRTISEKEIFELIYIAEKSSNHPIAKSITNFIKNKYSLSKSEYDDVYMEYISYCKHCGCCHKPVEHDETAKTYVDDYRHHIGHFEKDKCTTHEYRFEKNSKKSDFAKNIKVISIEEKSGEGVRLVTDKYEVLVGNDLMMKRAKVKIPESAKNAPYEYGTSINIAINSQYILNIQLKDRIKKDAKKAIKEIRKNGIDNIVLLTGDNKKVAIDVKNELNIDECYYNLLAKDKLDIISKSTANNIFVGDGINDAPALAMANVGIAMGKGGSDIAIGSADIVLTSSSLTKITLIKRVAKKMKNIIIQNISVILIVKAIVIISGVLGKTSLWAAVFGDVGIALLAIANSRKKKKKKKKKK